MAMLVMLPLEYSRRPKGFRQRWLREKFGSFDPELRTQNSKLIWIHAVSMGEVIASAPFVKELKTKHPSIRIVLSTVTDTGQKVARERISDIADIIYIPFDMVFIISRLLRRVKPSAFITIETELWPNIFRVLKKEGIPVLVMNGRVSEKSFNGYKKIAFFMKDVIRYVDLFCMQELIYAERIMALGADKDKVKITGNFKFDIRPSQELPEWAKIFKGPVIIAGSTHGTEEALILDAYSKLKSDFPQLNLIIAPRHPERFKEVEELIKGKGMECKKKSEAGIVQGSRVMGHGTDASAPNSGIVVLLDAVGELAATYGVADVAIIGGSFIKHGGQNPLEPAFWGKPFICGPHMENFPIIEDFYRSGCAVKSDAGGLYSTLKTLLESPEKRKEMGERAKVLYSENAGAVNRALSLLERYVKLNLAHSQQKPSL